MHVRAKWPQESGGQSNCCDRSETISKLRGECHWRLAKVMTRLSATRLRDIRMLFDVRRLHGVRIHYVAPAEFLPFDRDLHSGLIG